MFINLSWNYGAGKMTLDLDALFNCKATKVNTLMKFIREIRFNNEEAFNQTVEYLNESLEFYFKAMLTAVRGYEANPHGTYAYQRYKREAMNCEKDFKKYHKALNVLTDNHTTLEERIDYYKKRVE